MKKQQYRRKNLGWLLWIVASIFVQTARGVELSDEEKKRITGSYLQVLSSGVGEATISIDDENNEIVIWPHVFKFEKHTDEANLNRFSSKSLTAIYYLEEINTGQLVVMNDGSLQFYSSELEFVLYKIIPKETTIEIDDISKLKSHVVNTMRNNFQNNEFEKLADEVDIFLGRNYEKISILDTQPTINISNPKTSSENNPILSIPKSSSATEKFKQKLPIIICCIVLIIVGIFFYVQCCQSRDEPNIENLAIEQLNTNDLSNHYPFSTDLVLDVKDTESMQTNIHLSISTTTVSSSKVQMSSSNLFTKKSNGSEEVNKSKSMQTMETNSQQSVSITTAKITEIEKNSTNLALSESTNLAAINSKITHSESQEKIQSMQKTLRFSECDSIHTLKIKTEDE